MQRTRAQSGFTFIEILVVMGIITVLTSMVVVLIPMMNERSNRTKSLDNIGSIAKFMMANAAGRTSAKWPPYNGKNFTLAPVAYGDLNANNQRALGVFFSPGDQQFTTESVDWKRYKDVTKENLKNDVDFHELTSYAGRRNKDKDYMLTQNRIEEGAIIICDDDDGPLHHSKGLCCAFADGGAQFMEWDYFGMSEPDDSDSPPRILGEEATSDKLRALDSSN